jgi:F-type H+-transporting ATPase subunit epsilon
VSAFVTKIHDLDGTREFADVSSFVGEDASGSFGILAGHARLITTLVIGLARLRIGDGPWQYVAMPGAVLLFDDNVLHLSTRRCLIGDDYMRISTLLQDQLLAEEQALHDVKDSLRRMEDEILKRLWQMSRRNA